jgi:choline dehydrogenase-like flavoprotein
MELDGNVDAGNAAEAGDVCIVGAGPAGLALACELADRGHDVIVLDSGTHTSDPRIQTLNDGVVIGDNYAGLQRTRYRQLGGTTALWNTAVGGQIGAKYAPLDPRDLEGCAARGIPAWPVTHAELQPYYIRAQQLCGLGPFDYTAAAWHPSLPPLPADRVGLHAHFYQLGTRDALVGPKLCRLRTAGNVRLWCNTTALRVVRGGRRRAAAIDVAASSGTRWQLRARHVVLAGGAVENARLLLVSSDGGGMGNESGWVGRGFMEHPRDGALHLRPASARAYEALAFFDVHVAADGTRLLGRLALDDAVLRGAALPNVSATLLAVPAHGVRALRRGLAPLGPRAQRWLPAGGHGWSRYAAPGRWFDGWTVWLNLEQRPHADNRVVLGARRDRLGVPRAELHWRWRAEEQHQLGIIRTHVATALERAATGRVTLRGDPRPNPNAHHHAGTTRMHRDPRHGVVDGDCRVHALDNVWIAGASVFPTAGFANPVLTIVALAARLADRLHELL